MAPLATPFLTGFTLSLSLIVAIGAQTACVLRQGLRGEHVGAVVAVCGLLDVALRAAGVFGLGALVQSSPRALTVIAWAGAAVLAPHGRLLQFTYAMRGPSAWQAAGLVGQARERVLANLPPARIDVLGHGAAAH